MSHHETDLMSPVVEALHAARSALTVAGGRVALAQRRATRGDGIDRVVTDLASVPSQLAQVAAAVNRLAEAAVACEQSDLCHDASVAGDLATH